MKKLFLMALAVCLVTACEKPIVGDIEDDYFDDEEIVNPDEPTKNSRLQSKVTLPAQLCGGTCKLTEKT